MLYVLYVRTVQYASTRTHKLRGKCRSVNILFCRNPLLDSIASETVTVAMKSNKGIRQKLFSLSPTTDSHLMHLQYNYSIFLQVPNMLHQIGLK